MHWYTTKPDWMTERQWRTARTCVQAFIATASYLLGDYLAASLTDTSFSWKGLTAAVIIPAVSAAWAAMANGSTEEPTE